MLVTFSTRAGGRISINPDHVESVTMLPGVEGCEIRLASGDQIVLSVEFGKACAKLDASFPAPAAKPPKPAKPL